MPSQDVRRLRPRQRVAALLAALAAMFIAVNAGGAASAAPPSPKPSTSGAHATSAASAKRATFGVKPASNGKPDGRPSLLEGMTAGATFVDHVAVRNFSLQTYTLAVYAT